MLSRLFNRTPLAVAPTPAPLPRPPSREAITQFLERVGDGPVPTYPDAGPALVAASPAELMATQTGVIARIKDNCALAPAQFDRMILPVFSRYAEWAHLLPASEMNHHCGVGGLFRHGLEVAMHAARSAEGRYLGLDLNPSQRQAYFERWRTATLLAGLLHDIGKPLVDLAAVDLSGTRTWGPQVQSLYAWLQQHQLSHYAFYWRDGPRRHRHEAIAPSVAREIIGPELLAWLNELDCGDVLNLLMSTLAHTPDSTNTMADIVHSADAMSCDIDLAQQAKLASRSSQGQQHSLAALILATLRKRVETGQWRINSGSPLYLTDQGLLGVFPATLEAAIEDLRAAGHRAMPAERVEIAAILERYHQLTCPRVEGSTEVASFNWNMTIPADADTSLAVPQPALRVLRFTHPELILGNLPPPPAIKVILRSPLEDAAARQAAAVVTVVAPTLATAAAVTPTAQESGQSPTDAIEIEDRRNRLDESQVRDRERQAAQATRTPEEWRTWLDNNDVAGMLLSALVDALNDGKLKLGRDVLVLHDALAVRYPDAFNLSGIGNTDVIPEFTRKGWLRSQGDGIARKIIELGIPGHGMQKVILIVGQGFEAAVEMMPPPPRPSNRRLSAFQP